MAALHPPIQILILDLIMESLSPNNKDCLQYGDFNVSCRQKNHGHLSCSHSMQQSWTRSCCQDLFLAFGWAIGTPQCFSMRCLLRARRAIIIRIGMCGAKMLPKMSRITNGLVLRNQSMLKSRFSMPVSPISFDTISLLIVMYNAPVLKNFRQI